MEGRENIGGTWDLFKYPGIRSDSDMHTMGFRFKSWKSSKTIADGPSILDYLDETVEENNLRQKIQFSKKLIKASWSSQESLWNLQIENQLDTIGYQLALTADNIDKYATLYPLNELNTSENNWCNNVLVQYQGDCPDSIEVDFDYSLSLSSATGKEIDTVSSQAVFLDILSKKSIDFDVSWTNTTSIFWDSNNERYDVITPDSSETISATICAGICDSTKLNSALPLCDDSFGSDNTAACYDSNFVIQNEIPLVNWL